MTDGLNFIEKAKKIHDNKYDYSLVEYKHSHIKVKIICPIHGIFEQVPYSHLRGIGCPKCAGVKKLTKEEFIEKANKVHNNKYNYSFVEYINMRTKVKIICPTHGVFEQRPTDHINGQGCPKCCKKNKLYTQEEFIEKAKQVHGNKYDYSLVEYKDCNTKVKIICSIHGVFEQVPHSHLRGIGCSYCRESKGEKEIAELLTENNINYTSQYTFENCRGKRNLLPFDFYLPIHNVCIEYQGEQHFSSKWLGEENLKQIQFTDKIKREYCKNNNIKLIEIRYDENIRSVLLDKIQTLIYNKEYEMPA